MPASSARTLKEINIDNTPIAIRIKFLYNFGFGIKYFGQG